MAVFLNTLLWSYERFLMRDYTLERFLVYLLVKVLYTPHRGVPETIPGCFIDLTTVLHTPRMGFRSPSLGTLHIIYGEKHPGYGVYTFGTRYTQNVNPEFIFTRVSTVNFTSSALYRENNVCRYLFMSSNAR